MALLFWENLLSLQLRPPRRCNVQFLSAPNQNVELFTHTGDSSTSTANEGPAAQPTRRLGDDHLALATGVEDSCFDQDTGSHFGLGANSYNKLGRERRDFEQVTNENVL